MKHQWLLLLVATMLVVSAYSLVDAEVEYIGEDTDTKGDWVGKYGENGVILFAASDMQDLKDITAFDDGGNNRWDWENPTADVRGLLYLDGSGRRTGSCVYNNPDGLFTIETNLSTYQVAAHVLDWDSTDRIQTMTGFQGDAPADPDVPVQNPEFNAGMYHIWHVTGGGAFKLNITHEGGANWVMSGIFLDDLESAAAEAQDKLATTWGRLKQ